jgi:hypothetical protein
MGSSAFLTGCSYHLQLIHRERKHKNKQHLILPCCRVFHLPRDQRKNNLRILPPKLPNLLQHNVMAKYYFLSTHIFQQPPQPRMPGFVFTINWKKILNSTLDLEMAKMQWVIPSISLFNLCLRHLFHVYTGSTQIILKRDVYPVFLCKVKLQW